MFRIVEQAENNTSVIKRKFKHQFKTKEEAREFLKNVYSVLKNKTTKVFDKNGKSSGVYGDYVFLITENDIYDGASNSIYTIIEEKTSEEESNKIKKGILHFIDWLTTFNLAYDDESVSIDFIQSLFELANLSFSKELFDKNSSIHNSIYDIIDDSCIPTYDKDAEMNAWTKIYEIFYNLCEKEKK